MADNRLIFPIGFDLESALKNAEKESEATIVRLNNIFSRQPLVVKTDARGFRELDQSIDSLKARLKEIKTLWNSMPTSAKFDLDSEGRIKQLTSDGRALWDELNRIITSLQGVNKGISDLAKENQKQLDAEAKALEKSIAKDIERYNKYWEQKEKEVQKAQDVAQRRYNAEQKAAESARRKEMADDTKRYEQWQTQKEKEAQKAEEIERRKENSTRQAIARQNAEYRAAEEKRYQEYIAEKEKEVQANERAEAQKRAAQNRAASAARQAAHEQAMEAYKVAQALKAQEDVLNNLTAKLSIYNQRIRGQQIGSDAWSKTALEIRRITEELQKANQQMADFQQKAFSGLSDGFTKKQVEGLQNLRAQIEDIDRKFNMLYQNGRATNADGTYTARVNNMLKDRKRLQEEINKLLTTAADAQLRREKEINAVIEQRKAKESAIKAARQAQLAQLKQKRAENDRIRKILAAEENTIKSITAKLQVQQERLKSTSLGSDKFNRIAAEVKRLTNKLDKANKKMRELTGQTEGGSNRQSSAVRQVSNEFKKQDGCVSRLIKRLAVYASFSMVGNFLTNIREVTAQFELQRVSLGAIIRDQNKANALFSQIKQFALKSPVKILDLTKYVKQVAAYRIETDKLFDTTKRLADVSVGLGVDMSRIVLAYGQVKASSYLRAAEIRQFAEAGIPMLELLAEKFTKLNGEMVTTEEVMDKVSKRGVSFSMVEEIFKDMTDAGGMFYNMQEKQGNTLYGMWAKLGDAASVMYEQIGNTGWVSDAMKSMIQSLTELMRNWKAWANSMVSTSVVAGVAVGAIKTWTAYTYAQTLITQKNTLSHIANRLELIKRNATLRIAYMTMRRFGLSMNQATAYTMAFSKALKLIGAVGFGLLITGFTVLAEKIFEAWENAHRLSRELKNIEAETITLQNQSVGRFEELANSAVRAANGSREQREALEELQRTYKDKLPLESLTIDNLRRISAEYDTLDPRLKAQKDRYDELTTSIREYIAVQQQQKGLDSISEEYGKKINDASREMIDGLAKTMKIGRDVAAQIVGEMQRDYQESIKSGEIDTRTAIQRMIDAAKKYGVEMNKMQVYHSTHNAWGFDTDVNHPQYLEAFYEALGGIEQESADWENRMRGMAGAVGEFQKRLEATKETIKNKVYQNADGSAMDPTSFLYQQSVSNETMKAAYNLIIDEVNELNKELILQGEPMFKFLQGDWMQWIGEVDPDNLTNITTINFDAILDAIGDKYPEFRKRIEAIQKEWGNVAPTNATAVQIRQKLGDISKSFDPALDAMKKYLWDGSGEVDAYLKRLKEQQEALKAQLKEKQNTLKQMGILSKWWNKLLGRDISAEIAQMENEINALEQFIPFVQEYVIEKDDKKKKGGSKSDTRLQELQEIHQTLATINKEYDDLRKKEGKTKALEDIKERFQKTLDYTNKLGKKFGLHFDFPTEFKSLQEYRREILKVMETLKNLKGGEKAALELQTMIDEADSDELQKQIEKQLKDLADRISRTKTAKEFYKKILGQTGDIELASNISTAIYGDDGFELQKRLAEQIRAYFQNDNIRVEIPIDVIGKNDAINYKRLGEFAEEMKDELGEEPYKAIKKIAEDGQKDLAKTYEGYFKDLRKAESYASKRIELAQTTAEKIAAIRKDMASGQKSDSTGEKLISGFIDKEMKEAAQLEWDAFKGTPIYVQMFEDLEHASTSTLEMMRTRIDRLSQAWGHALDPTQLKEMQGRINEITNQLRARNPWKALREAYKQYKAATDSVSLSGSVANAGTASKNFYEANEVYGKDSIQAKAAHQELMARERIAEIVKGITLEQGKQVRGQKALTLAQQKAFDQQKIARGELEIANAELIAAKEKAEKEGKNPAEDPNVIAAQNRVKAAQAEVDLTQRVGEILDENGKKSKGWKESIESVSNEIFKYLNAAGELAHSVANIMESLGADEEDVQFWNTIGDAMGEITAGVEDLAKSILSLNIADIVTSALTAIPKMFVGFVNLFSAARIRNANKEIKRQQKLLDQLEYTYSRLEKKAEAAFGGAYITAVRDELRALNQEADAYLKQSEAEKSKGKKADKDKVKEYEESYRDALDEIEDKVGEVFERLTGADLTSTARDFAEAWLEAYKEFGNTATALSDKFHEMIENMMVESALARIAQRALDPVFKLIDNASDTDLKSERYWSKVADEMGKANENMDYGMSTAMKFFDKLGISTRTLGDGLSGISRDIATASEESINGLAAGITTQNFYMSQIHANVAIIARSMAGGGSTGLSDYTPMIQQSLENQGQMIRHQSEILAECRNIAAKCQEQTEYLRSVITLKNAPAQYAVSVRINQ